MVNDCIRIGLEHNVYSMRKLSSLSYKQLDKYNIYGNYKLCANARAAGILSTRRKSIRRGFETKNPYAVRSILIAYRGFKIIDKKMIRIPLGDRQYFDIPLNKYVQKVLSSDSALVIRSFTLTPNTLSISYSKEVKEIETSRVAGIDRNLKNLTYGNKGRIIQYDLSKAIEIAETTRDVIKSFRRNDARIRKKLFSKYGKRRKNRINRMLHRVSKHIVQQARENKEAVVFEDIRRIRQLYQRGNGQNRAYRSIMNAWSYYEAERQVKYKASWEGVPIIQLSKQDTRGTSTLCPQCGERLQEDRSKYRQLWCPKCKRWMDRDIVAVMNLSIKGLLRFGSSKGIAGEAMVQESGSKEPVILKVDAMKLGRKT